MNTFGKKDSAPIYIGNKRVQGKVTRLKNQINSHEASYELGSKRNSKQTVQKQDVFSEAFLNSYEGQSNFQQNYNGPTVDNFMPGQPNEMFNSMTLKYGMLKGDKQLLTPTRQNQPKDMLAGTTFTAPQNKYQRPNSKLVRPQSALMKKTLGQKGLIPRNPPNKNRSIQRKDSQHSRFKTVSSVKQKKNSTPYRPTSPDHSIDLPKINDLESNRPQTLIKQSRRSLDLTSNQRHRTDASYNDQVSGNFEKAMKYSNENYTMNSQVQANDIMSQLQKLRQQDALINQKSDENGMLHQELQKMIEAQKVEINQKNALIQQQVELQNILQTTQKKMHQYELKNIQLEDALVEKDQIQQEANRRQTSAIRKLNDQQSSVSKEYLDQTNRLNDQVKDLMKNNLELTNSFAKMQNGQSNTIVQAETVTREFEIQLSEKDREIIALKQQVQRYQSTGPKNQDINSDFKYSASQSEQQNDAQVQNMINDYETRLFNLQTRINVIEGSASDEQQKLLNQNDQIIQLRQQVASLSKNNQQLTYQLNEGSTFQNQQVQQQSIHERALIAAQKKLNERDSRIFSLEQQIKQLNFKKYEIHARHARNMDQIKQNLRTPESFNRSQSHDVSQGVQSQSIIVQDQSKVVNKDMSIQSTSMIQDIQEVEDTYTLQEDGDKQVSFRDHSVEQKESHKPPSSQEKVFSSHDIDKSQDSQVKHLSFYTSNQKVQRIKSAGKNPQGAGSNMLLASKNDKSNKSDLEKSIDDMKMQQYKHYLEVQQNFAARINDSPNKDGKTPFENSRKGSNDSKMSVSFSSIRGKSNLSKHNALSSLSRFSQKQYAGAPGALQKNNSNQEQSLPFVKTVTVKQEKILKESQKVHQLYHDFVKSRSQRGRSQDVKELQIRNKTLREASLKRTEKEEQEKGGKFGRAANRHRYHGVQVQGEKSKTLTSKFSTPQTNKFMQGRTQASTLNKITNATNELMSIKAAPQMYANQNLTLKNQRPSVFDTQKAQTIKRKELQKFAVENLHKVSSIKKSDKKRNVPKQDVKEFSEVAEPSGVGLRPAKSGKKMKPPKEEEDDSNTDINDREDEEQDTEHITPEDLMKPLRYMMLVKNYTTDELFEQYQNNFLLSAIEFKKIYRNLLQIGLSNTEVQMIVLHFKQQYFRTEIKRRELDELINRSEYKREYDSKQAKESLKKIGDLLKKLDIVKFFQENLSQYERKTGMINRRSFKKRLFYLRALTNPQIENLTQYLDKYESGMIYIKDIKTAVELKFKHKIKIPKAPLPTKNEIKQEQHHPMFFIIKKDEKEEKQKVVQNVIVEEVKENIDEESQKEVVEKKPDVRDGIDIDLVDIVHPLKYMIDFRKNLIREDGHEKASMDLMKYIEKFIIKKIIAVFDVDNNMLLSGDELRPIFEEYLEIYLSDQETDMIEEYFKKKFSRSEINTKEFYSFITTKFYVDKSGYSSKRDDLVTDKLIKQCEIICLDKIKPLITKERVPTYEEVVSFFSRFMTENEKKIERIYLRTFKLKLDTYEKLSQRDLYDVGAYLDKHETGVIPLVDIHHALLGGWKYKPFHESTHDHSKPPEKPTCLYAQDFFRPLKFYFEKLGTTPDQIWRKHDKCKKYLLSPKEFGQFVKPYYKIDEILPSEVKSLELFFRTERMRNHMTKQDLLDFSEMTPKRKFDMAIVQQAITITKETYRTLQDVINRIIDFEIEKVKQKIIEKDHTKKPYDVVLDLKADPNFNWKILGCNIVRFKKILEKNSQLNKEQIGNLADYLDKHEDGYIRYQYFNLVIHGWCKSEKGYDPKKPCHAFHPHVLDLPYFVVEDIIQPLKTILERKGIETDKVYERYDTEKNFLLSASEIEACVKELLNIDMFPIEKQNLRNKLKSQFTRDYIKKKEFEDLLDIKMINIFNSKAAGKCMWVIVTSLQKLKNDKDLMILQKKVRFDKYLIEKINLYETAGKKQSFKPNKETKRDKQIAERDKLFRAQQKARQGFAVSLRKIGYGDMVEKRNDYYVPQSKVKDSPGQLAPVEDSKDDKQDNQVASNEKQKPKFMTKKALRKLEEEQKELEEKKRVENREKAIQDAILQEKERVEKEEREMNVIEVYIRTFYNNYEMNDISIRDFKYCIHQLHVINDDTIDGMTGGKAIHNLAMYMNQTYDDGFLRIADIALEAKSKKFTF